MKYTLYILTEGTTIATQEIIAPEHDGFLLGVYLEELSRGGIGYRTTLRGLTRALWNEAMDFNTVFADFDDVVRIGLRRAWFAGAAECGISPGELSPEELMEMRRVIFNESARIFGLLNWVVDNNRVTGTRFRAVIRPRVDMWALRWQDVFTRARLLACSNQKYRWGFNALGHTKDPCNTCKVKLKDKVKRASFWHRAQVQPQNPPNSKLDCEGWG